MKTKVLITGLLLILTMNALWANLQERMLGGPQKQRIETAKVAFFSKQMKLTPDEAKVFWPLYDQYQIALDEQKRERRQKLEDVRTRLEDMTEDQINELIDSRLEQAENALAARKQFITQLRKVFPAVKVALYFKAEEQFQRELIERVNQIKENRRMP